MSEIVNDSFDMAYRPQTTRAKFYVTKMLTKKEHPCYVPYNELPAAQQTKDALFIAGVHTLLGA